ncbi:tryptophan-rich sensory protein [Gilvimarinus agarilyticus]|uniref:TspO/MBR family protein n=1 Tax=unclassified Gilvimarinus TaxID=2642066 RepID=UPI001C07FB64|nr:MULTISPECIES: TspO/MBR family protein [unclassified Gilvimarinus]MBU2885314.1 tryptophan-rich sensory protein [Gilvimarinus agarilyticus]MDO6570213.1 TspO/MBR family protein [Gilvimarinus sp. 2_MG-2023]MDO6748208.1 TspO/MBR family protein [Gilvimarinus sp. 1_MG-2023]
MVLLKAKGLSLLVWLVVCFAAAFIGGLASVNAGAFYGELRQPAWAPPGYVFGPVWTLLYALMAVAIWRVWVRAPALRQPAVWLFLLQLSVNALWSWLFFAWQLGAAALLDIVVLLSLLVATVWQFRRFDKTAAWLLAPYVGWVSFAGVLNYTVWRLNPGLL